MPCSHTDPEAKLGFSECQKGSEGSLEFFEQYWNRISKNWKSSTPGLPYIRTIKSPFKNIFGKKFTQIQIFILWSTIQKCTQKYKMTIFGKQAQNLCKGA